MSQEQAKYLCNAARDAIDAAIGQAWALAFPTANGTLLIAANYLSAASSELGGAPDLDALAADVAGKANEILAISAIPWPFVYAAIGPWANALSDIKARIPDIIILQPADGSRARTPQPIAGITAASVPNRPFALRTPWLFANSGAASLPMATHVGKGPKGYRRSDERIREDVCDALSVDPLIDASEVEVTVTAGKIVLNGQVENRREKRQVEDVALAARGAEDVENNLQVRA